MSKIVVLFEVKPTKEGIKRYLELAQMLKPMLSNVDGFISGERYKSLNEEGKLLSMNTWESEEELKVWRNNLEHRASQNEGKTKLFESYKLTVCSVLREYSNVDRENAPSDSNEFFYPG